jgi:NADH-quinone oxidoreductase subunit J
MFTDYLWAFELISFLILSSIIGSVVIAKKEKTADVKSA